MQRTAIQSDNLGAYAVCGDWIARPKHSTNYPPGTTVTVERVRIGKAYRVKVRGAVAQTGAFAPSEAWTMTLPKHWHPVAGRTRADAEMRQTDLQRPEPQNISLYSAFKKAFDQQLAPA